MRVAGLSEQDVASAAAGDAAAVRRVYEVLAPVVVGYLRAHGADDPESLAQDVFLGLLPRLRKVRGGVSGLRTLTFSIAHARLVDELRRRERHPTLTEFEPGSDPRSVDSAEHQAIARLESTEIVSFLDQLTEDQRQVVSMRVVAQLSLEETAAVLGKSVGSVKQLQRRALLALRQSLTREEVAP